MVNYRDLQKTFPAYKEGDLLVIAGPCAVESREDISNKAQRLAELRDQGYPIHGLRGGAFKPRTNPKSFQGLGEDGLRYLVEARERTGLPIVTEVMDPRQVDLFNRYGIDVWQIGSRNMQNYDLLREIGSNRDGKPVLMKRGMCAAPEEILGAIQYLGDGPVLFCLRGLQWPIHHPSLIEKSRELPHQRQHEGKDSRFWVDVDHIEHIRDYLKERQNNVIVGYDPSHPAGYWELVPQITRDAVDHGAEFLEIEIIGDEAERAHRECDGRQALTIDQLKGLMDNVFH